MTQNEIQPIEPIGKRLLHEKVSDALLSYIYRNGLKPGDKLPGERQLALELTVGRNSVRQGLCQLEEDGIVERMVGKGAFLRKEVSADSIQLKLLRVNYKDLLEIKINLEQLAIRRAIDIATDEQIRELKGFATKLCDLAAKGQFSIDLDREFHTALLGCGGSPTLSQLVLSLVDSLNSYSKTWGDVSNVWVRTIPYHMDIAVALEQRQLSFALAASEYIFQHDLQVLNELTDIHRYQERKK
ncbi:FadR/GntR family transcriptional regulator [Sphaerochaeta sp. PS]|uniref:FadR/GntR family transcriptional regulator n=1 Tax=Sphaerochaeta sp. PS TaxID=3076336 RepID=UPI0028A350EA|nr:FCD domain-containing protein [Sphaerochaeta sp. PS]MDT4762578.1 FCD domain-containing protein [Sphaerochaeta sp. PS]